MCEGNVLEGDGPDDNLSGGADDVDDERVLIPTQVEGKLSYRSKRQNFMRTAEVLEHGMCGGPVLSLSDEYEPRCLGMVEGIVPEGASPNDILKGHAAFVGVEDILDLCRDFEATGRGEAEAAKDRRAGVRVL